MKPLPDLHKQAMHIKNFRRLKHDGGRAWIKDSQLFDARHEGNPSMVIRSCKGTNTEGTKALKAPANSEG